MLCYIPSSQSSHGEMGKRSTMPRTAPNKALEPTANSVRYAPAVGGGPPRAFGAAHALVRR
jgi:hypothetical protein